MPQGLATYPIEIKNECHNTAVFGKLDTGKSWVSMDFILKSAAGTCGYTKRRGLIIDLSEEYNNFPFTYGPVQIQAISISDINNYTEGVRRIRPVNPNGSPMRSTEIVNTILSILDKFQNGNILIEDCSKILWNNLIGDKMVKLRHNHVSLILHFQSIQFTRNSRLFANISDIRLHKSNEDPAKYINYNEQSELFSIAFILINRMYEINKSSYVWIDLENEIIQGEISAVQIKDAVHQYVSENFQVCVWPFLPQKLSIKKRIDIINKTIKKVEKGIRQKYFKLPE